MTTMAALLSLRPPFAEAIIAGEKTVEVRRRPPRLDTGSLLVLYAGAPMRAVIGTARLAALATGDAETLWEHFGSGTGIHRAEFDTYLSGAGQPTCLVLEHARMVDPLPLNFAPPQSWIRLRRDRASHRRLMQALPRVRIGI